MPYKDPEKAKEAKKRWEEKNRGAGTRHKIWTMIFYEESSPNWREELEEMDVPVCVSPVHDKDVWTAKDEAKNPDHIEGELKKPHYHLLAEYPNPVSYEQFKEDFSFLGGTNIKYVKSKSSMALYLCHLSTSCGNKVVYDKDLVLEFGGANYQEWCSDLEDLHGMMKEMRKWIRDNWELIQGEFCLFQDWCDDNNDDWSRALDLHCSWAIGNYIERMRNMGQSKARATRCDEESFRAEEEFLDEPCGGLSTTPPQGGAEPRTPNPDSANSNSELGKSRNCERGSLSEPEPPSRTLNPVRDGIIEESTMRESASICDRGLDDNDQGTIRQAGSVEDGDNQVRQGRTGAEN